MTQNASKMTQFHCFWKDLSTSATWGPCGSIRIVGAHEAESEGCSARPGVQLNMACTNDTFGTCMSFVFTQALLAHQQCFVAQHCVGHFNGNAGHAKSFNGESSNGHGSSQTSQISHTHVVAHFSTAPVFQHAASTQNSMQSAKTRQMKMGVCFHNRMGHNDISTHSVSLFVHCVTVCEAEAIKWCCCSPFGSGVALLRVVSRCFCCCVFQSCIRADDVQTVINQARLDPQGTQIKAPCCVTKHIAVLRDEVSLRQPCRVVQQSTFRDLALWGSICSSFHPGSIHC